MENKMPRLYPDDAKATRSMATVFAMNTILHKSVTDWQEVQEALANNEKIHAWLENETSADEMAMIALSQSVIREAEERLGDKMPAGYSD
jgi:hypothetical protein